MIEAGYCQCDYNSPTFCTVQMIKHSRKQHRCYECRGSIEVGVSYERVFGLWDGETCEFKTCLLCLELREWATISVPCFCHAYGDLHDNVLEMVQDVAPSVPGFFMEYGRRMVKIRQHKRGVI